jgi:cation diffusion facilitator family transporter
MMLKSGTENKPASKASSAPVVLSMFVNLLLAVAKGIAGLLGNSNAMIADAAESFSDVMSSTIIWIGFRTATKAPDEDHPYGHGKAEPIASFAVVVFLLVISVLVAIRGVTRLWQPIISGPEAFTLYVLVVVIVLKELVYRFMKKKADNVGSTALLAEAMHNRSDAITSLVAFIGILIAVIGGQKFYAADAYASLVASAIIAFNAVKIFRIALNELMDAAPPIELTRKVEEISSKVEGVMEVEKCLLRKSGMNYWADMHVVVNGTISVRDGHVIAHKVKDAVMHELPSITDVLVHIEPNVKTGTY